MHITTLSFLLIITIRIYSFMWLICLIIPFILIIIIIITITAFIILIYSSWINKRYSNLKINNRFYSRKYDYLHFFFLNNFTSVIVVVIDTNQRNGETNLRRISSVVIFPIFGLRNGLIMLSETWACSKMLRKSNPWLSK